MKMQFKPLDGDTFLRITPQTHSSFLHLLQHSLLLGLKEEGYLTEIQYFQAEQLLLRQFRKDAHD